MSTISVIIPTLNEAGVIATSLADLRTILPHAEVIIADGGSTDTTVALAQAAGATVVAASRGRGPQCNAGAAVAQGELLVFLHADTLLPRQTADLIAYAFADPTVQIAKFRLSFDSSDPILALAARLVWFDSRLTSYGDQGMVVRRTFFQQLGGFPDWPLFEDVRLFELARSQTRVRVIPGEVITSARRFRANGAIPQLVIDLGLWLEYIAGIDPHEIAARYERGKTGRG
ncbi:MAG: TIGR04283 family arsenosugar biosynthesis glycosyltransferase [Oscillochloridaceae bacterium umkhey_bin13]